MPIGAQLITQLIIKRFPITHWIQIFWPKFSVNKLISPDGLLERRRIFSSKFCKFQSKSQINTKFFASDFGSRAITPKKLLLARSCFNPRKFFPPTLLTKTNDAVGSSLGVFERASRTAGGVSSWKNCYAKVAEAAAKNKEGRKSFFLGKGKTLRWGWANFVADLEFCSGKNGLVKVDHHIFCRHGSPRR